MSYFAETRLREVIGELVRRLRNRDVRPDLDYLPPLPQEGARRVVIGVKGRARVLLDLDLQAEECRVYRQVGRVPFSLEDGYEIGPAEGAEGGGTARAVAERCASGQTLAEALLRRLEEDYQAV